MGSEMCIRDSYESDNLGNFGDNVYRHQLADFVRKIDEFAILSVGVELSMQKRFQPDNRL